jgi:DNA-binding MarR family transcriptional regulator
MLHSSRRCSVPLNTPKITSEAVLRVHSIVELMRSTGEREFPAQLMSVFFWIASHDGCKQEDLVNACNMTASSVSRCVTWLGPRHRLEHRSGLRLVRRERDPDNYKAWRLYVTPKGQSFITLIEDNLTRIDITKAKAALSAYDHDDD